MERRVHAKDEQLQPTQQVLALRYVEPPQAGISPAQLLACRRADDASSDLWAVIDRINEDILQGSLSRQSSGGRLVRSRRITSIREDVRLNAALWDLAEGMVEA